ncbi:hypothetical protein AZF37_01655 [endosymbiont 'TC1' of Trimyema compressum]|uniref:hypothetical protein n=1 Tax=endosymbiont 'TC1' of Trimyema compressum TaxID=243899 RepID=UPI0007F11DF6|nr:hypothetical protein [endosymbiont 'TC1' of Trimyema compressum]AMP20050.1 hypothetical protein AZF37_01655 [endosymbiont 'TC1' of Trimyema compressum]
MVIGNHVEIIVNLGKVILANRETCGWIRVSNEVYEILKQILELENIATMSKDLFDSEEDYSFAKSTLDNLIEMNILVPENYHKVEMHKIISLQLTNNCNLRCTHCCVDADNTVYCIDDLLFEQWRLIIDKE